MRASLNRTRVILLACLILASIPYVVRLGASSLWDANEAFYTETPREMLESGDFVNPSFNYQPRFNKPPLSYWIVALFYKLFGVSVSVERLAIALAALAMIAIAFGLGRLLCGADAGLFAAIGLAIAPRFLMFSRRIMIDVYMALFMGLTLLFFALAEARPERRRRYLLLMYVTVGLGVLTKGPVAAALPALAFLAYLLVQGEWRRLREMKGLVGILIVGAIVLPWYAAIYAEDGWQYIVTFVLRDNLSRYTQPVWGPRRSPLFYFHVVPADMFPWSVFLLAIFGLALARCHWASAVVRRFRVGASAVAEEPPGDGAIVGRAPSATRRLSCLYLVWVIVIVLFFSLSRSKEDLYVLPIYPAAAALVGAFLAGVWRNAANDSHVKWARWTMAVLGVALAAAGAVMLYLLDHTSGNYQFDGARMMAAVAGVGGLAVLGLVLSGYWRPAVVASALLAIAFNWILVLRALPDFERFKPVRPMSEAILADAPDDALVGYYRYASPSMAFYLRRQIFEYSEPDEVIGVFASGKAVYCVMLEQDFEALRRYLPAEARVLASRPVFQVKFKFILNKREPPHLLLISNKGGAVFAQ